MVQLAAKGYTLRQIADELKCSFQTVNWWFTKHGYARQDLFKFRIKAEKELAKLQEDVKFLEALVARQNKIIMELQSDGSND